MSKLTLDNAKQLVVELVDNSPKGYRNPLEEGGRGNCLYDDGKGNSCIVGTVLRHLGLELPSGQENVVAWGMVRDRYTDHIENDASLWLCDIQQVFDQKLDADGQPVTWLTHGLNHEGGKVRTWRQALVAAREVGLL